MNKTRYHDKMALFALALGLFLFALFSQFILHIPLYLVVILDALGLTSLIIGIRK
jgi:hypothetical protein